MDTSQCELDAKLMKELGANTIRVYHVNPTADHDGCMKAFADNGIYLLVDLDDFPTDIDPVRYLLCSRTLFTLANNLLGGSCLDLLPVRGVCCQLRRLRQLHQHPRRLRRQRGHRPRKPIRSRPIHQGRNPRHEGLSRLQGNAQDPSRLLRR